MGLKRYYNTGALHFITWSCYQRRPSLGQPDQRDLLLTVLEQMRNRYRFVIIGYVIMPEHIHLLISEPETGTPSTVVQAIKLGFVRRVLRSKVRPKPDSAHHLWMRRFYDFNVWSQPKEVEKLRYMHRNLVVRGLVQRPEDWRWSSVRAYSWSEVGPVHFNDLSVWQEKIR